MDTAALPSPASGGVLSPTTGTLGLTNMSTSTRGSQDEFLSNESGEFGAYRWFGNGAMRASDDGQNINIDGGSQSSMSSFKARSHTGTSSTRSLSFSENGLHVDTMHSEGLKGTDVERSERDARVVAWAQPLSATEDVEFFDERMAGSSHSRDGSQEISSLPHMEPQDQIVESRKGKGVRFRTPSMEIFGMEPVLPGVASPYPRGGGSWKRDMHVSTYPGE